jgi:hypothetical protein
LESTWGSCFHGLPRRTPLRRDLFSLLRDGEWHTIPQLCECAKSITPQRAIRNYKNNAVVRYYRRKAPRNEKAPVTAGLDTQITLGKIHLVTRELDALRRHGWLEKKGLGVAARYQIVRTHLERPGLPVAILISLSKVPPGEWVLRQQLEEQFLGTISAWYALELWDRRPGNLTRYAGEQTRELALQRSRKTIFQEVILMLERGGEIEKSGKIGQQFYRLAR